MHTPPPPPPPPSLDETLEVSKQTCALTNALRQTDFHPCYNFRLSTNIYHELLFFFPPPPPPPPPPPGIPYSEHSSYSELRGCVQGLKPLKIIPTVNNGSAQKREEMQRTFQIWQQENERKSQSLVQSKLKISSGQK